MVTVTMAASGMFSNYSGLQGAIHVQSHVEKQDSNPSVADTLSFSAMESSKSFQAQQPGSPSSESESGSALVIDAPETVDETPSSSNMPSPLPPATPNKLDSAKSSLDDISPMFVDPNLPMGWSRKLTQRTMGASAGKYDVYIFSPDKKKIRSKTDLMLYLARNELDLDPDEFDFTVRGRHNTPVKRPPASKPKTSSPKKPKVVTSKPLKAPKVVKPKSTKLPAAGSSRPATHSSNTTDSQSHSSSGPKLIVKFNFPVARLKRTNSMKSKKFAKKKPAAPSRQDSQSSQTSAHETYEVHEELPNGEARLTNGLNVDDMIDNSNGGEGGISSPHTNGNMSTTRNSTDDSDSEADILI